MRKKTHKVSTTNTAHKSSQFNLQKNIYETKLHDKQELIVVYVI